MEKTELKGKPKQTPLEVFEKEITQRDSILEKGIQQISFNNKTYILDERKLERNKNGVKNA